MFGKAIVTGVLVVVCSCTVVAHAVVTIDTVPVGNAGNVGEWSGESYGGYGPDRICGVASYAYNIGKYEVTAGQYTAFLSAVGGVDTYALYNYAMSRTDFGSGITCSGGGTVGNPYTYTVATDFVNRPVNYVSYWDGCRFANWLHNDQKTIAQMPNVTEVGAYTLTTDGINNNTITRNTNWKWAVTSEDEWYKAAYHDKSAGLAATYFDYPTSNNSAPGQDMADVSGNNANYSTSPYVYPIDSGKYTTLVGEFQNSDSPYGTFDQGGNVWEWNESIPYSSSRGLRGGAFCNGSYGLLASYRHSCGIPTDEYTDIGFRVASVPEPGSITMLLGIALTALLYYWRKRV